MNTTIELKRRRFTLEEYQEDERLTIEAFPDVAFTVRELLG